MEMIFQAVDAPTPALCHDVAALSATNPFYTLPYIEAKRALGVQPWILALRQQETLYTACTAFMQSGRLNRSLEIPSVPPLPEGKVFWEGVARLCRQQRVSYLTIGSFASPPTQIPALAGEYTRRARCEYVLALGERPVWEGLSTHHKRNVKRARTAGVELQRTTEAQACAQHAALIASSMQRRQTRGEAVTDAVATTAIQAMLHTGAGELFQAVLHGEVLASMLVLFADKGAYYHSAGTSAEGMACGASHFLLYEIAAFLQQRTAQCFNLGGAEPENPGLERFKLGFGAQGIPLEAVECFLGSTLRKKIGSAVQMLQEDPRHFLQYALGQVERYVVYTAPPSAVPPPESRPGVTVAKMSDQTLLQLATQHPTLKRHVERYRHLGRNDAYAVWVDDQLAHIAWLITVEHDQALTVRNIKLRPGEVEITHCETLPAYRGQGLYPLMIRSLCQFAAQQGSQRVFMLTSCDNLASQRGIEKAGLKRCGQVKRLVFPALPQYAGLAYRGHRWHAYTSS